MLLLLGVRAGRDKEAIGLSVWTVAAGAVWMLGYYFGWFGFHDWSFEAQFVLWLFGAGSFLVLWLYAPVVWALGGRGWLLAPLMYLASITAFFLMGVFMVLMVLIPFALMGAADILRGLGGLFRD